MKRNILKKCGKCSSQKLKEVREIVIIIIGSLVSMVNSLVLKPTGLVYYLYVYRLFKDISIYVVGDCACVSICIFHKRNVYIYIHIYLPIYIYDYLSMPHLSINISM